MRKFFKPATLAIVLFAAATGAHASMVVDNEAGASVSAETTIGGVIVNNKIIPFDSDDGPNCYTPDPVLPEAGTLSMMAVGLGLIGLRLRRKNT